ncbi:MAG: glycosyltransferase family 4 protein [Planctomycetes bacterium]|nr:glycosyltransferase family 4 protein [Planctomycetota bacterium]
MKIAINVKSLMPGRGGGETYVLNLVKQLAAKGHDVHVFANLYEPAGVPVTFHKVEAASAIKTFRDLVFARNSRRMLEGQNFDVIFGTGKTPYVHVYRPGGGVHMEYVTRDAASASNPVGRKLRWLRRTLSLKECCNLILERRTFACPILKRVIVNSQMVNAHVLKWYDLPPERVLVAYNGVDLGRFSPANREQFREAVRKEWKVGNELVILFVANNFRLKGLRCLLQSLATIKSKRSDPFKALIVGKGRTTFDAAYAARLGLAEQVVFAGLTLEPERFYAAADILVHPTFHDPFANVCLEALACGLPVITTALNGASELITNGGEGFVVPTPRDVDLLADRIAYFFDPDARAAASLAARRLAEKHPAEANADQLIRVFEEVSERVGG